MNYLDFDIELRAHDDLYYQVAVRAPGGAAASAVVAFPFTDAELERHLLRLENAILRSVGRRRQPQTEEERLLQTFGQQMFDFLLAGEGRALYYESLREARHRQGLRLRLHIHAPALALLPWEFLYDPRRGDYVCLDPYTPLVRYPDLPQRVQPLPVTPPLQVLGMVASPTDLQELNVATEQANVERALKDLKERGLVELTWLPGNTAQELRRFMSTSAGPWHIFHFIGHGGFDAARNEGVLYLADEQNRSRAIGATQLSRLLAGQRYALRLVVLNACEGARGGQDDVLSSTAATLVRSGLPAVLAMQYDITDGAAVELAKSFYEAIANGLPVDTAVAEARNAVSLANEHSLEWGTPVLYMRSPDGYLFDVIEIPAPPASIIAPTPIDVTGTMLPITTPHLPSVTRPNFKFDWVTISAGEFFMGSDEEKDNEAYDNELPQHRLYLPAYYIAGTPVTVAQFAQFIQATGYQTTAEKEGWAWGRTDKEWEKIKGAYWAHPRGPQSDVVQKTNHPVTCVTWFDANEFCRWQTTVLRAAGQVVEVRLPTEAEWEKAARGTDGRIYPWGNEPPDKEHCNFNENIGDTTPVGHYPVDAQGLYDMVGNVWEWTSSLYKKYPYKLDDGREALTVAGRRVLRGGSFGDSSECVRSAFRFDYSPDVRSDNFGFRVVRHETAREN